VVENGCGAEKSEGFFSEFSLKIRKSGNTLTLEKQNQVEIRQR
jgi:hypothetical protein